MLLSSFYLCRAVTVLMFSRFEGSRHWNAQFGLLIIPKLCTCVFYRRYTKTEHFWLHYLLFLDLDK